MPFDGNGNYTLPSPSSPAISGAVITAAARNAIDTDLAAALSNCLTRDGQSPPSVNLPMGGKKLTNLAAGAVPGDSLRWEQLFSQGAVAALPSAATVDIGGVNTVAVEISGSAVIASLGSNYNGPRFLRFSGTATLTHSATLDLPGAANIVAATGDTCIAYPNAAANGWNITQYQRAALPPSFYSGQVLQTASYTDVGSSTASNVLANITAVIKNITPKSANSTLVIEVNFQATISAAGAGTNALGAFRLYNNATGADIGAEYTVGVESSAGTNATTYAACSVRATVANATLVTKGFLLRARYASATATNVAGTSQVWTIREIQN